jgi:predicted phage tail protein
MQVGRKMVHHGAVEVFAYQEALLIMAVFGIAVLAMTWAGFRRWLQYKEKMARLIAEQIAERSVQSGAQIERVETRLKAIEQALTDGSVQTSGKIESPTRPASDPLSEPGHLRTYP